MSVRNRGQGTSTRPLLRVSRPVYDRLLELQRELALLADRDVTFTEVIERLLADRKPVQP